MAQAQHASARSWADEVAWYSLLAALVLSLAVFGLPGLYSGMYFAKDLIIRLLVAVSLGLWGYAVLTGQATTRWHRAGWLAVAFLVWAAVATVFAESLGTALVGRSAG